MESKIIMTSWHWLSTKDQYYNNYIFWKDTTKREIRATYEHLVCNKCHKLDEEKALKLGIESDVKIRSRDDCVATSDGMICVTERFREVLKEHGVTGLSYIPLPDGKYYIVQPERWLHIDVDKAGFKYMGKPCPICGRYRSINHHPSRDSYATPDEDDVIFAPDVYLEDIIARQLWLLVSAKVKKNMKDAGITGIDYLSKW